MRIAELFRSLQGEGRLTGTDSVFVRASGCNLRCRYCDTPYASWEPEGEDLSVADILARMEQLAGGERVAGGLARRGDGTASGSDRAAHHAVITGGEPMLFAELIPLAQSLHEHGWHVTIETAGTLYLPVTCDLMSISPKLSNSTPGPAQQPRWSQRHEANRHSAEVIRRLIAEYDFQLKFVVDRPEDCDEVLRYLEAFPHIDRSRAMLMPQGTDAAELTGKAQWLEPYCVQHGLGFCPRRHIEWFGPGRGK